MNTRFKLIAPLAALLVTGLPIGANAKPTTDDRSTIVFDGATRIAKVHYHDLDITSSTGSRALQRRLWRAAGMVCREQGNSAFDRMVEACRRQTMSNLRPKMLAAIDKAARTQVAESTTSASGPR